MPLVGYPDCCIDWMKVGHAPAALSQIPWTSTSGGGSRSDELEVVPCTPFASVWKAVSVRMALSGVEVLYGMFAGDHNRARNVHCEVPAWSVSELQIVASKGVVSVTVVSDPGCGFVG